MLEYFSEMPNYFVTSAATHMGKEQVLGFIGEAMSAWDGNSFRTKDDAGDEEDNGDEEEE